MSEAEAPLPKPLPAPLSDPLRFYGKVMLFLVLPSIIIGLLLPNVEKVRMAAGGPWMVIYPPVWLETVGNALFALGYAQVFCTLGILPWRVTNAFYLRSFRNDPTSWPIRTAAQAALGRKFRLSGIRDPRRRGLWVVRQVLDILFLLRYSLPRYMNLEAGADWKARLWRSFGAARCALIDLTDLTPFVCEEIELVSRCLGLHRLLFVGDTSRSVAECQAYVLSVLGSPEVPAERVQVAIWDDTPSGRRAFAEAVKAFARSLPEKAPGVNPSAFPLTQTEGVDEGRRGWKRGWWLEFLLATLLGTLVAALLIWLERQAPNSLLVAGLLYCAAMAYCILLLLLLLRYLVACGSGRDRVMALLTLGLGGLIGGEPLAAQMQRQVSTTREGLRYVIVPGLPPCSNNLKQIGLATVNYADSNNGRLPPFAGFNPVDRADAANNHYGTAFFFILPYLEQDNLYKSALAGDPSMYRWDNASVRATMFKGYVSPSDPGGGMDQVNESWLATCYAANLQVFGDGRNNSLNGRSKYTVAMADGTSNTIFFTERDQMFTGSGTALSGYPEARADIPRDLWLASGWGPSETCPLDY